MKEQSQQKVIRVCDISRAYFYAKATRVIYIEIPEEDREAGDEHKVGKLELCLYGTRDAAQNWAATYTRYLKKFGFRQGKASSCNFAHPKRDIQLKVHGDDFMVVADMKQMKWLEDNLKAEYETKCDILAPAGVEGAVQEVSILNRSLRWKNGGIEYEA